MDEEDAPKRDGHADQRTAWWLLYSIGVLLVGLIALVELQVSDGGLREVLETAVVIGAFGLMAIWVRFNRQAMDLHGGRRPR